MQATVQLTNLGNEITQLNDQINNQNAVLDNNYGTIQQLK